MVSECSEEALLSSRGRQFVDAVIDSVSVPPFGWVYFGIHTISLLPFIHCYLSVAGACWSCMGAHVWVAGLASHVSASMSRGRQAASGGPLDIHKFPNCL